MIQWMNFCGVSMSCTRMATLATSGATSHDKGGDWLAPSHVYWAGMSPPFLKALLVSLMGISASVVDDCAVVVDVFWAEPPPPELHATAVTRRPRASLRSTGLFYPKEGMWQTASNPRR